MPSSLALGDAKSASATSYVAPARLTWAVSIQAVDGEHLDVDAHDLRRLAALQRFLGAGEEAGELFVVAVRVGDELLDQRVELRARGHATLRASRSGIRPRRRASSCTSWGSVRASIIMPFTSTI
jgi:hypothetical protein